MSNKKPKMFLIFKLLGLGFLAMAISGIVLTTRGFNDFESNDFMIGGVLTAVGIMFTIVFLVFGFRPEIHKAMVKSTKYIQNDNKDDLSDIASTSADISKEAVVTTAKAVKEGLTSEEDQQIYCKHCGTKIDADSKFCNKCGKEQ